MTREEAIADIRDNIKPIVGGKSLDMAIKALEQEPCTDAISREELLRAIDTWDKFGYTETGCFVREPKGDYVPYIHYDDVINCIKGMPPVTPAEKVGQCENIGNIYKCSCGYGWDKNKVVRHHFCPNCGRKVQEAKE